MTTQKVALVTGAGSGIGRAIATTLAQDGYQLVINDLKANELDAVAYEIAAAGGKSIPLVANAATVEGVQEMVDTALKQFGRIDVAIANAGLTAFGDFLDFPESKMDALLQLNLKGSFFLAQRVARALIAQGEGGRIILMSSNIGILAYPSLIAYSMTKAALQMLARSLALELAPHQIMVNAIAPGATLTPRTLQDDPLYEEHWRPVMPTGKVIQQEDIAEAVRFLISKAARQITGQTLVVDGGWSIQGQYPMDLGRGHTAR